MHWGDQSRHQSVYDRQPKRQKRLVAQRIDQVGGIFAARRRFRALRGNAQGQIDAKAQSARLVLFFSSCCCRAVDDGVGRISWVVVFVASTLSDPCSPPAAREWWATPKWRDLVSTLSSFRVRMLEGHSLPPPSYPPLAKIVFDYNRL